MSLLVHQTIFGLNLNNHVFYPIEIAKKNLSILDCFLCCLFSLISDVFLSTNSYEEKKIDCLTLFIIIVVCLKLMNISMREEKKEH